MPAPREDAATAGDDAADYLGRVKALAPKIAAAGDEIESARRLPPALLDALIEAGLFRMLLPRAYGGGEVAPPVFAQVTHALAEIDASTAWCIGQNSGCSMAAAYLAPEVARKIFGAPRGILAWGAGPNARAVAVEGGYRVTGGWGFASGSRHATWLGGNCAIHNADGSERRGADGLPMVRTLLFPIGEAEITDTWHVVGLRGTGSDSYAVHDLFVPAAHSIGRDVQEERRCPGRLYRLSTSNLYACGFAGVALGIARGMLDALLDLAQEKTPRGLKHALRDSPVFQTDIAVLEARHRAARHYLLGEIGAIWQSVARTNDLTLDQRMAWRLATTHAIQEALAVADAAYYAAGATAIFESNRFERRLRDMHAVAQQLQGRRAHLEQVGKHFLGLAADTTFV